MRIRKFAVRLIALAMVFLLSAAEATAGGIPAIIKGTIVENRGDISIIVAFQKSKHVEISIANIRSVFVLDGKKMSKGVAKAAAIGGGAGAGAAAANPDNSGKDTEHRLRDAGLGAIVCAGVFAALKAGYNWLTQKDPIMVYNADLAGFDNAAIIPNLPIGTKVRITLKNEF